LVFIASSSKADTIAVCDNHLKNVIVLDYQGKVQSFYDGSLILEETAFIPSSVCSTSEINLKQQYSNGTKTIHLDHHSIEKFLEVTEVEID
jgi:hypothetical protein